MPDALEIPPPPAAIEREPWATVLLGALPMLAGLGSVSLLAGRGGGRMLLGLGALLLLAAVVAGVTARRQISARARRVADQRDDYRGALDAVWTALLREPLAGRLPVLVGPGPGRPTGPVPTPPPVPSRADLVCVRALRRLETRLAALAARPGSVDLAIEPEVVLDGEDAPARARAVVCDAATRHDARDLRVEIAGSAAHRAEWAWVRWLPHAQTGGGATVRRLVVVDHDTPPAGDLADATVLRVGQVSRRRGRPPSPASFALSPGQAEALARRLAGRTSAPSTDPRDLLAPSPDEPPLRVPLGVAPDGTPVRLDLAEAAAGGHGPHGLLVGATGSGKSELLRTIVLGLALRHPPQRLALALIDFKGGATFAGLDDVPHVVGLATNLGADLSLVDRLAEALEAEVAERQQRLHDAGRLPDLGSWDVRVVEQHGPPPPRLVLIVDELSELVAARPDIVPVLVALGRVGRSLGIHLLLASQRWDEGRLGGLEAHVSYRIALRTFSSTESRAALGVPDAADLPQDPGHGLLLLGTRLQAFRAPAVSAPRIVSLRTAVEIADAPLPPAATRREPSPWEWTLGRLRDAGAPSPPVWVPPLTSPLDLQPLLRDLSERLPARPAPDLVVGARERPRGRGHEPLVLRGNPVIVGSRGSGVSTALRALAWSAVLQASPGRQRLVLLDLDDGGLGPLMALPHVLGCATRIDEVPDAVSTLADCGADEQVLVLVDGWGRLRDHPRCEERLVALLDRARPGASRVRVGVGARRWVDLRPAVRDLLGDALELRLVDPADSLVDRRRASTLRRDRPGHGLDEEGHEVLVARMPDEPGLVREQARHAAEIADFEPRLATPHLEIRGPDGSARSAALLTAARHHVERGPDRARIVLLRSAEHLHPHVPASMLLPWDHDTPLDGARQLAAHLTDRASRGPSTIPGPDVVVVADDPPPDEAAVLDLLVDLLPDLRLGPSGGLVVLAALDGAGRSEATVAIGTTRLLLDAHPGRGILRRPGRPSVEVRVPRPP